MKIYQENIKKYDSKIARLKIDLNRISALRLLIFLISITILIILIELNLITPVFILLSISVISFALVIKYHNKIVHLKKHTSFLKEINESEIQREKWNLEEFDTGQKFINPNQKSIKGWYYESYE